MYQRAVNCLIADRYAAVHGAIPATDFPHFCVVDDGRGPRAVLGYRRADEEPLFLEAYLDAPIEQLVSAALGRPLARRRIVEMGSHASNQSRATLALWATAASELGEECEVGVAVLTASLRAMFDRIGLVVRELGVARPERLADGGAAWGSYYESQPMVCMGEIGPARAVLARWANGDGGAPR
jgi:Thermostable hemolysin